MENQKKELVPLPQQTAEAQQRAETVRRNAELWVRIVFETDKARRDKLYAEANEILRKLPKDVQDEILQASSRLRFVLEKQIKLPK